MGFHSNFLWAFDWDIQIQNQKFFCRHEGRYFGGPALNKPSFNDESPVITDDDPTIDDNEDVVEDEIMVEFIFDAWSINYDVEVNPVEQKLLIITLLKKCRALHRSSNDHRSYQNIFEKNRN